MKIKGRIVLLVFAHCAIVLSTFAFESFLLASSYTARERKSNILFQSTGNGALVASDNATSCPPLPDSSSGDKSLSLREQVPELQSRLEEIHIKNARGEKLTQECCDSVLGLCVAAEEWESVLDVLDAMKNNDLSQEHSTYTSCLQSCFEMGNGASAQEILQAMAHALVEPEPADISLAVTAMCRNNEKEPGWWRQALHLLLQRPDPGVSVEAYDAVIACMVDEAEWKEAVRLLREMEKYFHGRDKKRIHPNPTDTTYRQVIECCVAADKAEQAVQILTSMTDKKIRPTVYTFELVISALSKKLQWRRALQLLNTMEEHDVPRTVLTYNTIISACARAKEVGMAKNLLIRMRKKGITPTIVTYNSVISACASTSRWQDALNVLDQCNRDPYSTPDIYTYTNAIRACAKGGKTERALSLHQVVKHKKLPLDSYFYAAIIEACAKAKLWQKALDLLHEMEEKGITPTDVIYSVTITACGNGGQWRKALDLLDLMRKRDMRINLITYNAAITALAKAAKQSSRRQQRQKEFQKNFETGKDEQLWLRAMDLLEQMKKDKIAPDGFSFSSAISCCGAEGRWEEALELIDRMQRGGPRTRPNKIAYTAAIAACGRSGEYQHALRLFRDMKNEGLSADIVAFNALFSALRVAEQADLTYEFWREMCGGKQSTATAMATAKADKGTAPDVITVTDVVATLSRSKQAGAREKVDEVFAEAVSRGILFSSDSLDSAWEFDLSGMSFPVARAACRYIISGIMQSVQEGGSVEDLHFVTGVGAGHRPYAGKAKSQKESQPYISGGERIYTFLREYVQEVLRDDFEPPIDSFIPRRAQGSIQIDKSQLQKWIKLSQKQ